MDERPHSSPARLLRLVRLLALAAAIAVAVAPAARAVPPPDVEPPATAAPPPASEPPAALAPAAEPPAVTEPASTPEPPAAAAPSSSAPETPAAAPSSPAPETPAAAAAGSAAPTGPPEPGAQTAVSHEGSPDETPGEGAETPLERFLPTLDLIFPEGALDLKVSRLVNKVLFEGQVRYAFVSGDITAFLRYRYYGYHRTTQIEVFDDISFGRLQSFSNRFDRTRGANVFLEWPHSYSFRTFALGEIDRISSN